MLCRCIIVVCGDEELSNIDCVAKQVYANVVSCHIFCVFLLLFIYLLLSPIIFLFIIIITHFYLKI